MKSASGKPGKKVQQGLATLGAFALLTGCGGVLSEFAVNDSTEDTTEAEQEDETNLPLGTDGSVLISVDGSGLEVRDLKIQPDGKLVVLSTFDSDEVVHRFETDGSLDPTFGTEGRAVVPDSDSTFAALRLEIQEDGGLIIGGIHFQLLGPFDAQTAFGLVRLTSDGTEDTTFGTEGMATALVGDDVEFYDMALQPDGKIVLVGSSWNSGTGLTEIALARFNSDGSLDDSSDADGGFGTGGAGTLSVSPDGHHHWGVAVAIDADGKIVVGGIATEADGDDFAVSRFTSTGQIDTSFSGDGCVTTPFVYDGSSAAYIKDIALQADGKIVAVGYAEGPSTNLAALVRYNSDGSLDSGFGDGGKIASEDGDVELHSIAIQADGKIVVAGLEYQVDTENHFGKIIRYGTDGILDSGFGDGGAVRQGAVLTSGSATLDDYGDARIAIQSDGKVVAAMTYDDSDITRSLALVRFLSDGTLDAAE